MEAIEEKSPEELLKELANTSYNEVAEPPTEAEEDEKPRKRASNWGLKKKKELNEEILKEIQKKLAEAWELMGTEYGRKLIEDVAVEVKKLCIINDLP